MRMRLAAVDRVVSVGLLALSLSLNVYLGLKVQGRPPVTGRHTLPPIGTIVPTISAKDMDGADVRLNWDSDYRPTVVYFFAPTCGWCARNLANIKRLIEMRHLDYRFDG